MSCSSDFWGSCKYGPKGSMLLKMFLSPLTTSLDKKLAGKVAPFCNEFGNHRWACFLQSVHQFCVNWTSPVVCGLCRA